MRAKTASRVRRVTASEPAIWGLVGGTPLVPLWSERSVRVLLKAEWLNPGGSVKDRPALAMLRDGLARRELPGKRLLDASSGNTAVAYAMLGAAAGVGVTICLPANASPERKVLIHAYGTGVIETDALAGSDGAIIRARELAASEPDRFWYADQYSHPANPAAHYATTGPEIWRDTAGGVTHLVAGVGTSGTLMGAGRYLRERCDEVRLVAVEPAAPFHGLEGLKHMATAMVPSIYDAAMVDETIHVETEEADACVRRLARARGLLVGWSTGAAVVAAERLAARVGDDSWTIVVMAPDGGSRYLSERARLVGET